MRTTVAVLLLLSALSTFDLQAQRSTQADTAGAYCLGFYFNGLQLSGTGLSAGYRIQDNLFARAEVRYSYDDDHTDYYSGSTHYLFDSRTRQAQLSLVGGYVLKSIERTNLYLGGVITYSISWETVSIQSPNPENSRERRDWIFGGRILLGIEYFVTSNISLVGEQQIRVARRSEFVSTSTEIDTMTSGLLLFVYL